MAAMRTPDEFTTYLGDLLEGVYDSTDRVALRAYFPMGQTSGGMITWWNALCPGQPLREESLRAFAGDFARRVKAYAKKHDIALEYFAAGQHKHTRAEELRPADPNFEGVYAIFVAKAPALVWDVWENAQGKPVLRRPKNWPLVNHYHFHLIDREWGHIAIKLSGHAPFGANISLNGHEWVQRQAQRRGIAWQRQSNCLVGGSDYAGLEKIAARLDGAGGLARLAAVCERWIYSACLCFALTREEQRRSGFHYRFSCRQIEYSRNLLFKRGSALDEVYQGLLERTRQNLDVPMLKTIFGRKSRPHQNRANAKRLEKSVGAPACDLTVFKLRFGGLVLKMYDKSERVLRVEVVVENIDELRTGRSVEKLPGMLARLEAIMTRFLSVVHAAHTGFLEGSDPDGLARPSATGSRRMAGVDLQKPRMKAVAETLVALAPAPEGISSAQLAQETKKHKDRALAGYNRRQAAYDLRKLQAKGLVEKVEGRRRYRVCIPRIHLLVGVLVLRQKVIVPVLAGVCRPKVGRPPKIINRLDEHYVKLRHQMHELLQELRLAA